MTNEEREQEINRLAQEADSLRTRANKLMDRRSALVSESNLAKITESQAYVGKCFRPKFNDVKNYRRYQVKKVYYDDYGDISIDLLTLNFWEDDDHKFSISNWSMSLSGFLNENEECHSQEFDELMEDIYKAFKSRNYTAKI